MSAGRQYVFKSNKTAQEQSFDGLKKIPKG
jgi:hypothetical protein